MTVYPAPTDPRLLLQPVHADGGPLNGWHVASAHAMASNSLRNESLADGVGSMGAPRIAQENLTIDQIGCYVASAGTNVRLVVMQIDNQADPYAVTLGSQYATALVDAGQVSAGSTGGKKITLGSPLSIPKGTAFGILVVAQGGSVGVYHEGFDTVFSGVFGSSDILAGPRGNLRASGLSGAVSTFTPSSLEAPTGACGFYRRSA